MQQPKIFRRNTAVFAIVGIVFLMVSGFGIFQNLTFLWKKSLVASTITSDKLGNIIATNNDQLTKLNPDGSVYRIYSNKQLGTISSVDASNPLKILLFYQPFSRILFLDNTLTENGNPIYLDQLELEQATAVCSSFDNGFWVFNQIDFSLYRYNQNLQLTNNTKNINQFLNQKPMVNFMVEYENRIYLNDSRIGILVFDIFGTYLKTIPIKNINRFQLRNDRIIYSPDSINYCAFDTRSLKIDTLAIPEKDVICGSWFENKLFLLKKDSLFAYHFN